MTLAQQLQKSNKTVLLNDMNKHLSLDQQNLLSMLFSHQCISTALRQEFFIG